MIILDASLAAKLVLRESDSEAAERWFLDVRDDIVAPDLIAIEVSQAIVRKVNARVMTSAQGWASLDAWRTILDGRTILLLRTSPGEVERAAELAIRLGHPVKDCVYLALAMEHRCELVTSDARFAVKARHLYPAIKLLADYGN